MRNMVQLTVVILLVVLLGSLFVGCATIIKGSTTEMQFNSTPSNAQVYINGELVGNTPLELQLKKNQTYEIEFRKEGYTSKTYNIKNEIGPGWIILDLLFGYVGLVVDWHTGAWYELSQDNVDAILARQNAESRQPAIVSASSFGQAETLQEMEVTDAIETTVVVRNPEVGVLIVTSVIPRLSFESNMGIIKVDHDRPGEWIVHLHPGTNLITFKAEGYKTVSDVRLVAPRKKARKVEVRPLQGVGYLALETSPSGAEAVIESGRGEAVTVTTPVEKLELKAGVYSMLVHKPGYEIERHMVMIGKEETERRHLDLRMAKRTYQKGEKNPQSAFLYSLLLPGVGQAYAGSSTKRSLSFSIGAFFSWIITGTGLSEWKNAKNKADYLYSVDPTGRDPDYRIYDEYDKKHKTGSEWRDEEHTNLGLAIGFGVLSCAINTWAAFDASNQAEKYNEKRGLSMSCDPRSNGIQLVFTHSF